ncbi:ProQ/FINO family protein [Thalassospira sp.]|uniref:ProQ/FINO family protein n=1 Tax=Thalassospira sp. TaxID=1912094 RepID=UPI0027339328|nr:ProQ/FINO family protein [Thalassospira sp.]MDP2699891.1 ProQ/FINO family protein [Thalassospira sp.]
MNAAKELQALLRDKIAILPVTSNDRIKPFQIGAHDLFCDLAKPEVTLADLKLALRRYTAATGYLMALGRDDSSRYRLDGSVDAPVSDDNREHARQIVKRRFAKMQQKRVAPARDAPPVAPVDEPAKPVRAILTIPHKSGAK